MKRKFKNKIKKIHIVNAINGTDNNFCSNYNYSLFYTKGIKTIKMKKIKLNHPHNQN